MATSTSVNESLTALENHVASIFQALGGYERVTSHPILFESIAAVDSVIRRVQQLEAKAYAPGSSSTPRDDFAVEVAFLKETISTLMDLKEGIVLFKKALTNPSNNATGEKSKSRLKVPEPKPFNGA